MPIPFESALLRMTLAQPPDWAATRIEAFPEEQFRALLPFVQTHNWLDGGSINISQVIGTRHPDYAGLSWDEFLRQGKRMAANHALWESNPGYYTEQAHKEPEMSYLSLDGQRWFVDADGNHRTCIARFDFARQGRTMLHGVTQADWRFDHAFADVFAEIQDVILERRLGLRIRHRNKLVSRADAAGWKLDTHCNTAEVEPGGAAKLGLGLASLADLSAAKLVSLTQTLKRPIWRRWFGR
jgi:hypothetical protein